VQGWQAGVEVLAAAAAASQVEGAMRVLAAVVAVVAAVAVAGPFGGLRCFRRDAQLCWELETLR
jgi:hypothetical protein